MISGMTNVRTVDTVIKLHLDDLYFSERPEAEDKEEPPVLSLGTRLWNWFGGIEDKV
jgi:hypothetical protein